MVKISVIVPIYNMEQYLRECLDSVISQSLQEIEIVCINDGSTDNTQKILDEYEKKDNRIKNIYQINSGLAVARNEGIKHANGEYLLFLDSDDKLETEALQKMYALLEINKYDILYFSADVFYEEQNNVFIENEYERLKKYYHREQVILYPVSGEIAFVEMSKNNKYLVSACLQIIKREYLLSKNIKFTNNLLHEDNLYTFFTLLQANKVGCVSNSFYKRRVRSNSIMTSPYTYKNVYGLFYSYYEILMQMDTVIVNKENFYYVDLYLKRLLDESIRIYNLLPQNEKDMLINELSEKQKREFQTHIQIIEIRRECEFFKCELEAKEKEKIHILNSVSYKIGRCITYIPRKMRGSAKVVWKKLKCQ